jgi:hypothetical protein
MAEAATVIQLIQFSVAVVTCCYEYISEAKSAPKEIQRVIDETTTLKGLLEQLKIIANNPDDQRFITLKTLNQPHGDFENCSKAFIELNTKSEILSDVSDIRRRLQWPLEAKAFTDILDQISRYKQNFYLALAGDFAIQQDSIQNTVIEVRDTMQNLEANNEKEKVMRWLQAPDPSINHNSAKSKREPNTCNWLLQSDDFTSWLTKDSTPTMWLHAIPSTGKTVLSYL